MAQIQNMGYGNIPFAAQALGVGEDQIRRTEEAGIRSANRAGSLATAKVQERGATERQRMAGQTAQALQGGQLSYQAQSQMSAQSAAAALQTEQIAGTQALRKTDAELATTLQGIEAKVKMDIANLQAKVAKEEMDGNWKAAADTRDAITARWKELDKISAGRQALALKVTLYIALKAAGVGSEDAKRLRRLQETQEADAAQKADIDAGAARVAANRIESAPLTPAQREEIGEQVGMSVGDTTIENLMPLPRLVAAGLITGIDIENMNLLSEAAQGNEDAKKRVAEKGAEMRESVGRLRAALTGYSIVLTKEIKGSNASFWDTSATIAARKQRATGTMGTRSPADLALRYTQSLLAELDHNTGYYNHALILAQPTKRAAGLTSTQIHAGTWRDAMTSPGLHAMAPMEMAHAAEMTGIQFTPAEQALLGIGGASGGTSGGTLDESFRGTLTLPPPPQLPDSDWESRHFQNMQ